MLLVPPGPGPPLPSPLVSKISRLDQELTAILQNENLDDDTKLSEYSQVLERYLSARKQYSRPTPVPVVEEAIPPGQKLELDSLPKKHQKKAELLLERIRRSPSVGWNSRQELVIDGKTIPDTNIVDLIDDVTRPTSRREPKAIEDFVRALKKDNVPRTLVSNTDRFDLGRDTDSAATSRAKRKRGQEDPFVLPSRVPRPKKTGPRWDHW